MEKTIKNKKYKRLKIFAIVIVSIVLAITILGFIFIDNKNIEYEHFEVKSVAVNSEQIRIVHLSDLHFPKIKVNIDSLIEKLSEESPNIIAITGDLIDESATIESCGVIEFLEKLKVIAPVFYVSGNHEVANYVARSMLSDTLKANDITVLENESVNIKIGATEITLIGLADNADYKKQYFENNLNAKTNYKILLAHRPEKWDNYISQENEFQPNLILTGHAHGGQFRFFGQGAVAPNQGIFPKYDGGSYKTADGNSAMIVSRGIGNSIIPFRFNNKPHVPIITISK